MPRLIPAIGKSNLVPMWNGSIQPLAFFLRPNNWIIHPQPVLAWNKNFTSRFDPTGQICPMEPWWPIMPEYDPNYGIHTTCTTTTTTNTANHPFMILSWPDPNNMESKDSFICWGLKVRVSLVASPWQILSLVKWPPREEANHVEKC